ncbi:MAG: hypothetical protein Q4A62_10260 [Eikenella sp.]|nr:hypothetical protein [Eikenella sp.]
MANYAETLSNIYGGELLAELDEKLSEVVRAAELTGKVGSITLSLKVKAKGSSGQIELTPAVKAVVPEHERGSALMFATPEGNLQLQDPRQANLDLKEVPKKVLKMAAAE